MISSVVIRPKPVERQTLRSSWKRRLVAGLAAVAVATSVLVGSLSEQLITAFPADAAPRVSVQGPDGTATVSASGSTEISVSGTGFQSVQGGFGGIYVLFGWVDDPSGGTWKPSKGGATGVDYLYVPDTEAKDNAGYQRFVTFPGSGTSAAANGGELASDGTWSLTMRTPGARFIGVDRNGEQQEIDCTEVSCGVITIGAHGVVNPANETFTPVNFTGQAGATANIEADQSAAAANRSQSSATGADGSAGGGVQANPQQAALDALGEDQAGNADSADSGREESSGADGATAPVAVGDGVATVGLQQDIVQLGRVLGFTGRGFSPGEQVVATIAGGDTGAGPLIAGEYGEVAGAIPIPTDLVPGTHILRLSGAGTEQTVQAEFTAIADPLTSGDDTATSPWSWGLITVLIVAGLILVFIIVSLIMTWRRKLAQDDADENAQAWAAYEAYYGKEVADAAAAEMAGKQEKSSKQYLETAISAGGRRAESRTEAIEVLGTTDGGRD